MFGTKLEPVASTERCAVMATSGLVIARFWLGTETEEVAAFRIGFEHAGNDGAMIAALVVLDADTAAPSKEVRDAMGRLLGRYSERLVAWGGCVCGRGLSATSKRTMMRVIMSLARLRCAWTVENRPEAAARWLADQTESIRGEPGDAEAWIDTVARMRAADPSAETA